MLYVVSAAVSLKMSRLIKQGGDRETESLSDLNGKQEEEEDKE